VRITRRTLQFGLGLLWLLDGALQCQSFMFTRAFGRTVIKPAGAGQPAVVAHSVHWAASLIVAHPVLTNTGFAAIQLCLGLGMLSRRSVRLALLGTVVWGVAVWWLGEGIGGLTTGATLLTGAPGAALLYAVVAVLAWPGRGGDSSIPPSLLAVPAWFALWAMGAGMQLAAGNDSGMSFASMFADAGRDAGGWIGHIDAHLAQLQISNLVVAAVIGVEVVIAMWALVPGRARQAAAVIGAVFGLASWLLVQGLGDLTSGEATDPNTGPLIILMALAVLGVASAPWRNDLRRHAGRPTVRPMPA
jgi:hypothetical protein